MALKALFMPDVPFETLFIPYIYKEIYFDGIYLDVFNQKKDMVVLDIGANIGVVTQYMRDYAKKVYAIEPSSEHYEALAKNKEFNGWDNVETFKLAIAGHDGEVTMHKFANNRTCNSYTNDYGGESEVVPAKTFETFFKENNIDEVDFVKFDVEGAEDDILLSEGFIKVADKIKAIEIEFHHANWPDLAKHLINLGFKARRYECSAIVVLFTR